MSVDTVFEILRKLLDVLLVWGLLYAVLKALRKNVKIILMFKLILIVLIVKLISYFLDLITVGYLIDYVIEWLPLALVIIFQPEIRSALEKLGYDKMVGKHHVMSKGAKEKTVFEIIKALEGLKKQKMGALVTIERNDSLAEYINRAQPIRAEVNAPLLMSIFFEDNPLHNGAVIIEGEQITCSNALFPVSDSLSLSKRLGTRHRAALGISEVTDCLAIVLSEETGRVSLAMNGQLIYNLPLDELKIKLLELLSTNKNLIEVSANEKK